MWCDNFDADLLKCVPGIEKIFEPVSHLTLWTLCNPTDGKINCPAYWNGAGSFFWLQDEEPEAERDEHGWVRLFGGLATGDPFVKCTPLEVARDLWCHHHRSTVIKPDGRRFRLPAQYLQEDMLQLMHHIRGQDDLVRDPLGMLRGRAWQFFRAFVSNLEALS